jgi:hypothetical protein
MVPVVEQLMRSPDEENVARYACSCAANILRQSPEHRAAYGAAIAPRVFALVKHATAIVLRASAGGSDAAIEKVIVVGASSPQVHAPVALSGGGAVADVADADAASQRRLNHVEWQPPEYLVAALSFLTEFSQSTETNVIRTTLMLLAGLRKLPRTPPVLSVTEAALMFFMRHANGPLEQRHILIDGGVLSLVFSMLANMGHGNPGAYVAACCTLYDLVASKPPESASSDSAPIIRRVMSAAFAFGPVNDQGVPVPLWNFVNGVAGYPAEIVALLAAWRSRPEGEGSRLDGNATEQGHYAHGVTQAIVELMAFGVSDGSSDFSNGCWSGHASDNPRSWWHALVHRLRALLKNSRNPSAVTLLNFCAAAAVVTAGVKRGAKSRFR